ncbi:hypothetical protein, conserved [Trypanosoma brucei gambiense DAL972]|uniref:T. brucei spp.-specific protein n=1 Tax=Trypanosoma brucei gambiense (strain MHOM/CI/86/DAL972) TaxID=679716 RepID=C9ZVS5_TRYB9|nr:hypothetical protein, conserved [Trypanosoma brucei gambiense DAL972]CBH13513.1 hypothetical protein, conserved [Trypanosoma brucei gambiense DAL972]|eukprot:XP_011775790.1 hypothetical protein, conserved [Trypanosoma brucei gambiense DAL972]
MRCVLFTLYVITSFLTIGGTMKDKNKCTFRYFEVLPIDHEPEYQNGYVCDICFMEYSEGPFFHCSKSGKDVCLRCGGKMGLTPFTALVSKVMRPTVYWSESESSRAIALCYQIHRDILGCHFIDGANLLISTRDDLPSYFIDSNCCIEKSIVLSRSDIERRFPWAGEVAEAMGVNAVSFHETSACNDQSRLCFLSSFRVEGAFIEFRFSDGFCELVHCENGTIVAIRDSAVLSCFLMGLPVRWGRSLPKAASSVLEWYLKGGQR